MPGDSTSHYFSFLQAVAKYESSWFLARQWTQKKKGTLSGSESRETFLNIPKYLCRRLIAYVLFFSISINKNRYGQAWLDIAKRTQLFKRSPAMSEWVSSNETSSKWNIMYWNPKRRVQHMLCIVHVWTHKVKVLWNTLHPSVFLPLCLFFQNFTPEPLSELFWFFN